MFILPHFSDKEGVHDEQLSQAASNSLSSPEPTVKGPKLVYVVENDRISSVITELIVRKNLSGGEVRRYANGQWAFDGLMLALRDGIDLPDLVILDLDLPLMSGWEFLDALVNQSFPRPIRVFVLTSSIYPDDRAKALSYKQVTGFFTKPLKDAEVVRMQHLLQEKPQATVKNMLK